MSFCLLPSCATRTVGNVLKVSGSIGPKGVYSVACKLQFRTLNTQNSSSDHENDSKNSLGSSEHHAAHDRRRMAMRQPHAQFTDFSDVPQWPQKNCPTPYEVFGMRKDTFNVSAMKKLYIKLARLYHPDSHHMHHQSIEHLHGSKSSSYLGIPREISLLSVKDREERFKKVTSAYQILKDDKKRSLYDNFGIGWNYVYTPSPQTTGRGFSPHSNTSHRSANYQQNFYNAGTWEDYRNMREDMNPENSVDNRKRILAILIIVAAVVAYGELILMTRKSEQIHVRRREIHEKSVMDLFQAYVNYGYGKDRESRINRFVLMRANTPVYDDTMDLLKKLEGAKESQ